MTELEYWVWLVTRRGVGPKTARSLVSYFGSAAGVYNADREELPQNLKRYAQALSDKNTSEASDIVRRVYAMGGRAVTFNDPEYPRQLRLIDNPPAVLYVRGKPLNMTENAFTLAVVGTRNCSKEGYEKSFTIARDTARWGGTVVTGLARGIDTAAVRGALDAGGHVVAVIGSGIDITYPPENTEIQERVAREGTLVSEYPPGTRPLSHNFPARNRIVSGVSKALLVVEAPRSSGAIITADDAIRQGIRVFSVPGPKGLSNYAGSNLLIELGNPPAETAEDILKRYAPAYPTLRDPGASPEAYVYTEQPPLPKDIRKKEQPAPKNDTPAPKPDLSGLIGTERALMEAFKNDVHHIDELIRASGASQADAQSALMMLELKGYIEKRPGNHYALKVK